MVNLVSNQYLTPADIAYNKAYDKQNGLKAVAIKTKNELNFITENLNHLSKVAIKAASCGAVGFFGAKLTNIITTQILKTFNYQILNYIDPKVALACGAVFGGLAGLFMNKKSSRSAVIAGLAAMIFVPFQVVRHNLVNKLIDIIRTGVANTYVINAIPLKNIVAITVSVAALYFGVTAALRAFNNAVDAPDAGTDKEGKSFEKSQFFVYAKNLKTFVAENTTKVGSYFTV